jgi:lipopolysaccharide export system permease protein
LGELGWRIGMGLTALNFVLLALAVSAGNPRVGRSGNLIFLLLAFVFYYNLLNIGQGWVASGMVGLGPFMLGLHGSVMAMALMWLAKRHFGLEWRWRRPGQRGEMA